jgi:class 3 adenylate cyclase
VVTRAARAGVASGYCTLGDWGEERWDFIVIGSPANLASRLQTRAGENRVLISESTAALVRGAWPLGPQLELKGLGKAVAFEAAHDLDRTKSSAKVPRPRT